MKMLDTPIVFGIPLKFVVYPFLRALKTKTGERSLVVALSCQKMAN